MIPSLIARLPNERENTLHVEVHTSLTAVEQVAAKVQKAHAGSPITEQTSPLPAATHPSSSIFTRIASGITSYSKKGVSAVLKASVTTTTASVKKMASVVSSSAQYAYHEIPGVKTATHLTAKASISVGAACYQNVPGAKKCAKFLASCALPKLLPEKGILKEQIEERRRYLATVTESSICQEACSLISNFAAGYLQHQVVRGEEIDEPLRSPLVTSLLYNASAAQAEYGFFGDVLKMAITDHPELVSEIIEANLLKNFCTIIKRLKEVQEANSNWLVDLTKDILTSYTSDLKKLKANVRHEDLSGEKQALFFEHISKILHKITLPNGVKDLDLPIPGKKHIARFLMNELEHLLQSRKILL